MVKNFKKIILKMKKFYKLRPSFDSKIKSAESSLEGFQMDLRPSRGSKNCLNEINSLYLIQIYLIEFNFNIWAWGNSSKIFEKSLKKKKYFIPQLINY